jgi:hypothetical protein
MHEITKQSRVAQWRVGLKVDPVEPYSAALTREEIDHSAIMDDSIGRHLRHGERAEARSHAWPEALGYLFFVRLDMHDVLPHCIGPVLTRFITPFCLDSACGAPVV